jgi:hypothetical protein
MLAEDRLWGDESQNLVCKYEENVVNFTNFCEGFLKKLSEFLKII